MRIDSRQNAPAGDNFNDQPKIAQTEDSKKIRHYHTDLNELEKSELQTDDKDEYVFAITFLQHPAVKVTIRRQDIFKSGAQVIVNAANSHLGGGGGIDGAIHSKGGKAYVEGHQALQKKYPAGYVLGHAAMIDSGELKKTCEISNVIVVAGPQGSANHEKEDQLYSCYYNSLALAQDQNMSSIAFPSISTGIFGFPRDRAACISLKAIYDFLRDHSNTCLKNISIHFLPSEPKAVLKEYQKVVANT